MSCSWLLSGVAGFIGSNILETLLRRGDLVVGLDNFATGSMDNLLSVERAVGKTAFKNFQFVEGDIRKPEDCLRAAKAVRSGAVLCHQAALGSVPRSIADPATSMSVNVMGFVNILDAARAVGIKRVVYASSSSVYGDSPKLPKVEAEIGKVLSPYAATKRMNEITADAYASAYGMEIVGLRYFNVFGPRQSPNGPYAAVIPRFMQALKDSTAPEIYGDGKTSRDFCYVDNAVQANYLAGTAKLPGARASVYNVAVGEQTSLVDLFRLIRAEFAKKNPAVGKIEPAFKEFRSGDVRHSLADISAISTTLGYKPSHRIAQGLAETVKSFLA